MAERLDTANQHAVRMWLKGAIKSGQLKNCTHLGLPLVRISPFSPAFIPRCDARSFLFPRYQGVPEDTATSMLVSGTQMDMVRCPKDCVLYRSKSWASVRSAMGAVPKIVTVPARNIWSLFFQLPEKTQIVLIIFLIAGPALVAILKFSPQWMPQIIELIKAFRGGK